MNDFLLPEPGECLDIDMLAPTMELGGEFYGSAHRQPMAEGTVVLESKEFHKLLDVATAAHGVLKEGKNLHALRRAYDAYTRYCNGLRPVEHYKNSAKETESPGQKALRDFAALRAEFDKTFAVLAASNSSARLSQRWKATASALDQSARSLGKALAQ